MAMLNLHESSTTKGLKRTPITLRQHVQVSSDATMRPRDVVHRSGTYLYFTPVYLSLTRTLPAKVRRPSMALALA